MIGVHASELVVLAAAAVRGDAARIRVATEAALAAGEAPVRVRAVLRMVHPFAGFPRALDAWIAASPVLPGAGDPAPEPADASAAGRAVFDAV